MFSKFKFMVKITENAKKEINATLRSPQIPAGYALRVGLKGGACSAAYLLGFDKPTPEDESFEIEGVEVLIDKRHLMYLIGIEVDYQLTEQGPGYTIRKT
ncbi:MAG: iron-sulfur cluster assembly protein [Spirosomataceae bacterium]|jgi:iron-sulfur cluster assembly protein